MNVQAGNLNVLFIPLLVVILFSGCKESPPPETTTAPTEPAPEPTVYTLTLAQTWSANAPIFGETTINFAEMVNELSAGQLVVEVVAADEHQQPFGVFEMVKSGEYDMGHSASYYWKDIDPNTLFFTTLPFGMLPQEQYAWFYHGGGMELMHKVYSKHGLMSFPGGNTGNQMGGWFRKEIKGLEDLKGLKMRIPGFAGEVLKDLGAEPVNLAPGELYDALNDGQIDALEWVGPSLDLGMKFHQIARFYYTGWHEPATELQFLINEKSFEQLPVHLQKVLKIAMRTAAYDMYTQSTFESAENWSTIQVEYPGVELRTFPPEVLEALYDSTRKLLEERSDEDPLAKNILSSQSRFFWKVRRWTQIADQAYLNSQPRGGVATCRP
ncbi:TRAP transporter substrate-binding protein [Marinobacter confluentis]|uniref:ABC transporter substrate-binding protein n=1 Tax=Marinobacter confluentis TaxID=1697557 RepID=A0A4Z1CI69_9GAMM|nr:TRAP transporter substrate-binding protein DctP [Marinobacter confluentis]TGN40462.1 ABC transporter substrate-binding protein [Marinobacter confluentis]